MTAPARVAVLGELGLAHEVAQAGDAGLFDPVELLFEQKVLDDAEHPALDGAELRRGVHAVVGRPGVDRAQTVRQLVEIVLGGQLGHGDDPLPRLRRLEHEDEHDRELLEAHQLQAADLALGRLGRRDQRHVADEPCQGLSGRVRPVFDVVAGAAQAVAGIGGVAGGQFGVVGQRLDIGAVALVEGDAPRGDMGAVDETVLGEIGHLIARGGRAEPEGGTLGHRLARHGNGLDHVLAHDEIENLPLTSR